jgi:SOS-response transcriptional repressor LexA
MEFAAWLLEEIDRQYDKHADFARAAGVRDQKVSSWLAGTKPTMPSIMAIARGLHMDWRVVAASAGYEVPGQPLPRSPEELWAEVNVNLPVAVPVITDLVAHMGSGGGFVDDYAFLPASYRSRRRRNYRAISARGDCMKPEITDGDVVIFDLDSRWHSNDVVVAAVDGHVVVRRLVEVAGRPALRSDADGETHGLTDGDQIFGKAISIQRTLLP